MNKRQIRKELQDQLARVQVGWKQGSPRFEGEACAVECVVRLDDGSVRRKSLVLVLGVVVALVLAWFTRSDDPNVFPR